MEQLALSLDDPEEVVTAKACHITVAQLRDLREHAPFANAHRIATHLLRQRYKPDNAFLKMMRKYVMLWLTTDPRRRRDWCLTERQMQASHDAMTKRGAYR